VLIVPVPFLFMAMNLTQMAADLAFIVADLPDGIVMDQPDGRTLVCVAGPATQSRKLDEAGLMPEFDLQVMVQTSLLVDGVGNSAPLTVRQRFTHARTGLKFRIERLRDAPDGLAVILECVQVTA